MSSERRRERQFPLGSAPIAGAYLPLLLFPPVLAILGGFLRNSFLLLLMVASVSILVLSTVFSKRLVPPRLHPLAVFAIAFSLLFQRRLIFNGLVGWDVFTEYYLFQLVNSNSFWNPALLLTSAGHMDYNAMLSVTVLPAVYSKVLNMNGEWVFVGVFGLLGALVPVILYEAYSKMFGKLVGFMSAVYFVVFPRYIHLEGREMIAYVFFALLILVMASRGLTGAKKQILLIVFSFGLIVSHYSMAYIYLFVIVIVWLSNWAMRRGSSSALRTMGATAGFVLLFSALAFSWYIDVSVAPSEALWDLVRRISGTFATDFFNIAARSGWGGGVLGSGSSYSTSMAYEADAVVNKAAYVFIIIGVTNLFRRRKKEHWGYSLFSMASALLLVIVLVVPYLSPAFLLDRFYQVTLLFLAPLFVLGGRSSFGWIVRRLGSAVEGRRTSRVLRWDLRLVGLLLVIILLFKVGFVYEVLGDVPESTSISFARMRSSNDEAVKVLFYSDYVPEQDILGARWLWRVPVGTDLYADRLSSMKVLRAYGLRILSENHVMSEDSRIGENAYVYLGYLNVAGGILVTTNGSTFSINATHAILADRNKVYSNGGAEIYGNAFGGQLRSSPSIET